MDLAAAIIVVLLVIQTCMLLSFGLIAVLYFFVIQPMRKQIESNRVVQSQGQHFQENKGQHIIPLPKMPDNMLPSIDDVPEESLYGEEEPKYPTDAEVEQNMAFEDPYSRVELDENNTWKMLGKIDGKQTERVRA